MKMNKIKNKKRKPKNQEKHANPQIDANNTISWILEIALHKKRIIVYVFAILM